MPLNDNKYKNTSLEELLKRAEKADNEEATHVEDDEETSSFVPPQKKADPQKHTKAASGKKSERRKEREEKARQTFKKLTNLDEEGEDTPLNIRTILGGDLLGSTAFRRNIWYMLMVSIMAVAYVSCRYACQREIIKGEELDKQLVDLEFKVLTAASDLTEQRMRKNIEGNLPDTALHVMGGKSFSLPIEKTKVQTTTEK